MDLIEYNWRLPFKRHPWEMARLALVRKLMSSFCPCHPAARILDLGCGDAYVALSLADDSRQFEVHALDTALTDAQLKELSAVSARLSVCNTYEALKSKRFDIILMLDLIEHIDDDAAYLSEMASTYLNDNGRIVIATPAFQPLIRGTINTSVIGAGIVMEI